jgi:hypothetical protein
VVINHLVIPPNLNVAISLSLARDTMWYDTMDRADVTWSTTPDDRERRRSCSFRSSRRQHHTTSTLSVSTMKISAALALAAVGGASAYSVNRSTLRSLGQRSVAGNTARSHVRSNDIKMEGERTPKILLNSCF